MRERKSGEISSDSHDRSRRSRERAMATITEGDCNHDYNRQLRRIEERERREVARVGSHSPIIGDKKGTRRSQAS